jgi:hypothetical protein
MSRPANIGTPEKPVLVKGEELLEWLRAAGARNISQYVPPEPVSSAQ